MASDWKTPEERLESAVGWVRRQRQPFSVRDFYRRSRRTRNTASGQHAAARILKTLEARGELVRVPELEVQPSSTYFALVSGAS